MIIEESEFALLNFGRQYVVNWIGQSGSSVNIVSSRFRRSGGILVDGESESNLMNSVWVNNGFDTPAVADRIINLSSGDMNITASSLIWNSNDCDLLCQSNAGFDSLVQRSGSGKINFSQAAVGFNFETSLDDTLITLDDEGVDGFTADEYTWIQATSAQSADDLKTITGLPTLRTDLPAFNTPGLFSGPDFDLRLATPSFPGELIDVVPASVPLVNPITLVPIDFDVVGNPRADANGFRDIGAIQLSLAPVLTVDQVGDGQVGLTWNEPLHHNGLSILNYEIQYVETGSSSSTSITVGPSPLTYAVTGLNNGTEYHFEIAAIYSGPEQGPFSNRVTATPYGDLDAPVVVATAGDGEVLLEWTLPDLGGRAFERYTILWREAGTDVQYEAQYVTDYGTNVLLISGLRNGTTYDFQVGVSASGEGSELGMASATPHGDIGTVNRSPDESLPATKQANAPRYWERAPYSFGDCTKSDVWDEFGSVWEIAEGENLTALILKSDRTNDLWRNPEQGLYGTASAKDISHVIVCTAAN